jgi:hypothetical protein
MVCISAKVGNESVKEFSLKEFHFLRLGYASCSFGSEPDGVEMLKWSSQGRILTDPPVKTAHRKSLKPSMDGLSS